MLLLLSEPKRQQLANAAFLIFSRRWYIPVIKLQDINTWNNNEYVNFKFKLKKKTEIVVVELKRSVLDFHDFYVSAEKAISTLVSSSLYLYSPIQML